MNVIRNLNYVQIQDITLLTQTRDPRAIPDSTFRYVDISNVNNLTKIIERTTEVIGKDAPSRARKIIKSNDIIVSTVRPNLNAVAIVPDTLDEQICSTGFS